MIKQELTSLRREVVILLEVKREVGGEGKVYEKDEGADECDRGEGVGYECQVLVSCLYLKF